jgi:hypothetical protein
MNMDHHENEQKQTERHHYLFHIFRMEKEENPASASRAEALLQYLKKIFFGSGN